MPVDKWVLDQLLPFREVYGNAVGGIGQFYIPEILNW